MKLIFVYNADSGLLSSMFDLGHKILNPETYECNLCSLTYGNFVENTKWKEFRKNLKVEMEFLHRNEFEKKYDIQIEYPAILSFCDKAEIKISKEELNRYKTLDELISEVNKIISEAEMETI